MPGVFDQLVVVLSVLIAMLAVYAALDLTARVAAARGATRLAWVVVGGLAAGVGLWATHFVGVLALHLPVVVAYTVHGAAIALAIAVAACALAMTVAATQLLIGPTTILAGALLGLGSMATHLVSMSAVRVAAFPVYDSSLLGLATLVAVIGAIALVLAAAHLRNVENWWIWRRRVAAAAVVGLLLAISHYTAMSATRFEPNPAALAAPRVQLLATNAAAFTTIGTCVMILTLALGGASVDRALRRRLAATAEHSRLRALAEEARDAAVRAQHDAEQANRVKSEFLAAMSHELRTPLNAIAGYTELLQLGVHGPMNAKQQEDLARIQRSQKHLLGLINDVLNFTKLESGRVPLHPRVVSLESLLTTVEAMLAPEAKSRRLRYVRQDTAPTLEALCDPDKAEQILANLASNAVKFTPAGGTIEITTGASGDAVHVRVSDTGVGIPSDKLETIFEPFVQVERTFNRRSDGAGLGLSISRDLARAMGGDLRVESVLGRGSTFTLSLPRPPGARSAARLATPGALQSS